MHQELRREVERVRAVTRTALLTARTGDRHHDAVFRPVREELEQRSIDEREVDGKQQCGPGVAAFTERGRSGYQRGQWAAAGRIFPRCREVAVSGPHLEGGRARRAEDARCTIRETLAVDSQRRLVTPEASTGAPGEEQARHHLPDGIVPQVDEAAMRARFAAARVARLATVRPDGSPHIVPICFALLAEASGDVIVSATDDKPKTTYSLQRLKNVITTPAATLLVDHYEEEWGRVWWIRVDGDGRVIEGGSGHDRAVAALKAKYEQYQRIALPGAVLAIDVRRWRGWAYDESG